MVQNLFLVVKQSFSIETHHSRPRMHFLLSCVGQGTLAH